MYIIFTLKINAKRKKEGFFKFFKKKEGFSDFKKRKS